MRTRRRESRVVMALSRQKTRAVASLETRIQVVASIEVLTWWEVMVLYVLEALWSVRNEL